LIAVLFLQHSFNRLNTCEFVGGP